jgi:hypothetical protein
MFPKTSPEDTTVTINAWTSLKPKSKQTSDGSSKMTDSKPSANPSFSVTTNDGRHRLTFRWKPSDSYHHLSGNLLKWLSAFLEIFKALFGDRDGSFLPMGL